MTKRSTKNLDGLSHKKSKKAIKKTNVSKKTSKKKVLSEIEHIKRIAKKDNKIKEDYINPDKDLYRDDRKKFILMWVGVFVCMLIIVAFWIYSSNNLFKPIIVNEGTDKDWDEISEKIESQITQMKEELSKVESFNEGDAESKQVGATTSESDLLRDIIINASSTISTSTNITDSQATSSREIFKDIGIVSTTTASTTIEE